MNPESKVFFENLQKALKGEYSVDDLHIEFYKLQERQFNEGFKLVVPKEMNLYETAKLSIEADDHRLMSLLDDMYYGCGYEYEEPELMSEEEEKDAKDEGWIKLIHHLLPYEMDEDMKAISRVPNYVSITELVRPIPKLDLINNPYH